MWLVAGGLTTVTWSVVGGRLLFWLMVSFFTAIGQWFFGSVVSSQWFLWLVVGGQLFFR